MWPTTITTTWKNYATRKRGRADTYRYCDLCLFCREDEHFQSKLRKTKQSVKRKKSIERCSESASLAARHRANMNIHEPEEFELVNIISSSIRRHTETGIKTTYVNYYTYWKKESKLGRSKGYILMAKFNYANYNQVAFSQTGRLASQTSHSKNCSRIQEPPKQSGSFFQYHGKNALKKKLE